jgi:hypothetical protein
VPSGGSAPSGECTSYDPAVVSGLPVTEAASEIDELATFTAAVAASSLHDHLAGAGPFTIFAPSNDAFGRIPTNVIELAAAGSVDSLTGPVTVEGDVLVLNGGEARVSAPGSRPPTRPSTSSITCCSRRPRRRAPAAAASPGSSTPGSSVPMASVPNSSAPGSSVPAC